MDDKARKEKNRTIKEKGKATRLRHSSMRPLVVEMKLDLKCLNNSERDNLFLYFTQCRFDTRERNITSLDKDGNSVERLLTLPAKFIQSVYSSLRQDMASLAAKRNKTGKKNGKLKFRSEYTAIELNQYGNTHWICYRDEWKHSLDLLQG